MTDVAPIDAGATGAHVLDVTPAEYHRDPLPVPSLSSSIANELLSRSPLHAWSAHPKLGGEPSSSTKATDIGTIVHRLVLGKGADVEVLPYENFYTKRAKRARDLARLEGRVPMLAHVYAAAKATSDAIRSALEAAGVELEGESEVVLAWREDAEHGPVWCRSMLDHLFVAEGRVIDIKKTMSAHPDALARAVVKYGYDVQGAAYTRAVERCFPQHEGRVDYVLAFVESEPPFATNLMRLDGVFRMRGEMRWARAVRGWSECLATGNWPGYRGPDGDAIGRLEAPAWLLRQMQMEEA